jgi:predicted kinase
MIVMMAGLPGAGKSTLARLLAQRLPGAVLDKDIIRAALFQPEYIEYSQTQDDFCQEIMLKTAAYLLGKDAGLHVLLDGRTFSRRYQREQIFEFCKQMNTPLAILECICSEPVALERLSAAAARGTHLAANRTTDLYRQVQAAWELIDDAKCVIHTDADLDLCVERALGYLTSQPPYGLGGLGRRGGRGYVTKM